MESGGRSWNGMMGVDGAEVEAVTQSWYQLAGEPKM